MAVGLFCDVRDRGITRHCYKWRIYGNSIGYS